jgi:hypothetical protein
MERCLASSVVRLSRTMEDKGEADSSAGWREAAFTRNPFACTFLKPRVYYSGLSEQPAPANVS